MNLVNEFEVTLYEAAEQKITWYNSFALSKMLENYRAFHSAIKNIFEMFEKKKLLLPDPYKKDKRVVDISLPDNEDFPDSDGPTVFGIRLSDYESALDFLCNYTQFTVNALTPEVIKKLFAFNSFLEWNDLNSVNNQSNHRYFSTIVLEIKNSNDTMALGLFNNMLTIARNSMHDINKELKNLTALHRQLYKIDVRKNIFNNPSFRATYNSLNVQNAFTELKKVFPSFMEKKRFYPDLIEELVQEEFGPSKEAMRSAVLNSFKTASEKEEKKVAKVDTRAMIFEVLKILQAFAPTLDVVFQKIQDNHDLLQGENKGAFNKLIVALRTAFGLKNKTIEYKVKCIDMQTNMEKFEIIDYNKFMDGLIQRSRLLASLGAKNSPIYTKLEGETEEAVLEYVQKRINDCQAVYGVLTGFDGFFKSEVMETNRSKVKGIKIDLEVLKNTILKANKYKAEYVSTVTTEAQMKKLGISNE